MTIAIWAIIGATLWLIFAWIARGMRHAPRQTFEDAVLYGGGRLYVKLFHGLRVAGADHLGDLPHDRPVIYVANHTAGIDPVLIEASQNRPVRWMMAADMRIEALAWFWDWRGVIFVAREGRSSNGLREAIRHLKTNGTLGIFPEGGIERPPRTLLPFMPGLGMLVHKSDAVVVPFIVDGTPQVDPAWASLWRPSKSRITIKPPIDFKAEGIGPGEIADDLRRRYHEWTGWPLNDDPPPITAEQESAYGVKGRPIRNARGTPPGASRGSPASAR